MADRPAIEWTDATFNPWSGCERVSPACAHCYADTLRAAMAADSGRSARRTPLQRRDIASTEAVEPASRFDAEPLKVFCASMADVFEERADLDPWRARLWELIEQTPMLHWQLLTKRPENVAAMAPWRDRWPTNVWVGTSVENSRHTFRVRHPARGAGGYPVCFCRAAAWQPVPKRQAESPSARPGPNDWVIAGGRVARRSGPSTSIGCANCETLAWTGRLNFSTSSREDEPQRPVVDSSTIASGASFPLHRSYGFGA